MVSDSISQSSNTPSDESIPVSSLEPIFRKFICLKLLQVLFCQHTRKYIVHNHLFTQMAKRFKQLTDRFT